MSQVRATVYGLLRKRVGPERNIEDETRLMEEGVIDSFGLMELILSLEREYGILFTEEEYRDGGFATPGRLIALVTGKVGKLQ